MSTDDTADVTAVADLLAQRWGPGGGAWQCLADARPRELVDIILNDAKAVVALLQARGLTRRAADGDVA